MIHRSSSGRIAGTASTMPKSSLIRLAFKDLRGMHLKSNQPAANTNYNKRGLHFDMVYPNAGFSTNRK